MQVAALLEENHALKEQVEQLAASVKQHERENSYLRQQLEALRRRLFGPRSEKLSPGQLSLEFSGDDPEEEVVAEHAQEAPDAEELLPRSRRRGAHGRRPLPRDLPRNRIEYHPEDCHCKTCGNEMQPIGEETTEELEYVPASFVIHEHVRVKYACKDCADGVVIAPLPDRPIEKGRPGPGLLAHVAVSKYGDHLPLNRQSQMFGRHGVDLSRSTLCDWVADTATLVMPVYDEMKRQVLAGPILQTDDTPVTMQRNWEKKHSQRCFLWVYVGYQGPTVLDFTISRSRDGPESFLEGFEGYLQADAFVGYDRLYASGKVVEVGCMAHARRYFHDAMGSEPKGASAVLAGIQRLYKLEKRAKAAGLDEAAVHALRQKEAVPILNDLHDLLKAEQLLALPESKWGEALQYALNQWEALKRYTEDGRLNIDNNASERAMRKVAVGRKNWIFAGSEEGGRRAAILYSMILSCQSARVEPFAYLRDVLARVGTHPAERMAELTPAGWKAARQEATATV